MIKSLETTISTCPSKTVRTNLLMKEIHGFIPICNSTARLVASLKTALSKNSLRVYASGRQRSRLPYAGLKSN